MSHFPVRKRRGAAMIEFAFFLPIIVLMLSGLLDFSWYIANSQNVMQAARDGARTASATLDDPTTAGNDVVIKGEAAASWIYTASALGCDPVTVDQFTQMGLNAVTVTVACNYEPILGVFYTAPFLPDKIRYEFTMFQEVQ